MKNLKTNLFLLALSSTLFFISCSKITSEAETDIQENAQQVGDVMASVDEAGGSAGAINTASIKKSVEKTFARYAPDEMADELFAQIILPKAFAASCSGVDLSSCDSTSGTASIRKRTFNDCLVASASFSGDVTFSWSNTAACSMQANGERVTRSPNFKVTGRRGATLNVTKTGTDGQVLTRTSASVFSFTNDGINRKFTNTVGSVIFDHTTSTTAAITVTGASRNGRVLSGGTLRVRNNITSTTCDYSPTAVTWNGTCNCPVSGSWAGSCSTGKTTNISITGCGTATYTEGTTTENISFDRCGN